MGAGHLAPCGRTDHEDDWTKTHLRHRALRAQGVGSCIMGSPTTPLYTTHPPRFPPEITLIRLNYPNGFNYGGNLGGGGGG